MKFTANREAVEKLPVDFIGFIFHPESRRFVGSNTEPGLFNAGKIKIAVFVDENAFEILGIAKNLGFDHVQLHGKENPKTCQILRNQGLRVIKAFNLHDDFDFPSLKAYEKSVDYLLFDTKTVLPGGSGKKFNWKILEKYTEKKPFLLSGGIKPEDAEEIKHLEHPQLFGIDLNSGFEDEPGLKNVEKLKKFISQLQVNE